MEYTIECNGIKQKDRKDVSLSIMSFKSYLRTLKSCVRKTRYSIVNALSIHWDINCDHLSLTLADKFMIANIHTAKRRIYLRRSQVETNT